MVQGVNNERADYVIIEDVPISTSSSSKTWMEILNNHFEHGIGIFHASVSDAEYVTYYPFTKEQQGVICLQNKHHMGIRMMLS